MMLNPAVAISAELSPKMSKDTSVTVAIATPVTIGSNERYTFQLCLSPISILEITTVKNGIVAENIRHTKTLIRMLCGYDYISL